MKPTKCPAREKKNEARKAKKKGGEKAKSKSQDCCVTFKPKNYLEILLSAHAELCKLMFCIWNRRPRSVQPVNRFVVSFSSLYHDSDQKSTRLASKRVFRQNLRERVG